MPAFRRKKRKFNGRKNGSAMSRRRTTFVPRRRNYPKSLFGNKRFVVLKYHEDLTLVGSGAGQPTSNVYSANGMFAPNITSPGSGHQPRGYDEVMPLYQHYTVIQSKCTVTFMATRDPELGNTWEGGMCGILLGRGAAPFVGNSDMLEDRNVTFSGLPSHFSAPAVRISRTFNCRKFLGFTHPLSEDTVRGEQPSNPFESAFFHVFIAPSRPGVQNGDVVCSVDIQYMAVLTEPKQPAQS